MAVLSVVQMLWQLIWLSNLLPIEFAHLYPELAYGDMKRSELITPGAVLIFELEMIEVQGPAAPPATELWTYTILVGIRSGMLKWEG